MQLFKSIIIEMSAILTCTYIYIYICVCTMDFVVSYGYKSADISNILYFK